MTSSARRPNSAQIQWTLLQFLTNQRRDVMTRERKQNTTGQRRDQNTDAGSERLIYFVVGWIVLMVLAPLHGLLVLAFFFTDSVVGVIFWLLVFGLPLALVDLWALNWFRDNMGAFRGINRHLREQGNADLGSRPRR